MAVPHVLAFSVIGTAVGLSRLHVDIVTRLADLDVLTVSVDCFTRLIGAFGLALQSAYACDTRLAMNCCLCTVRRCHTHRKEER